MADKSRLEEALRILNALWERSAEDSAGEGVHGAPHAESARDTRVDEALAILDALGPAAAAAPNEEMEGALAQPTATSPPAA